MPLDLSNETLGFIGGGNMATAIIGGLVARGADPQRIHVSEPSGDQRQRISDQFGVTCHEGNSECARASSVLVLAVKPQMMQTALSDLPTVIADTQPLLISIAAGIRIADIQRWADTSLPVVRVMPNTPSLVNAGVSGVFAPDDVGSAQRDLAGAIMEAVGPVVWLEQEDDVDVVTGISGSGPAYFFKLMETMVSKAEQRGLDSDSATTLVLNTALGAAKLALASEDSPAELRRKVTSPNGTTAAALQTMGELGIENAIESGIDSAIHRSAELAAELGDS